jgi:hypothetical protein
MINDMILATVATVIGDSSGRAGERLQAENPMFPCDPGLHLAGVTPARRLIEDALPRSGSSCWGCQGRALAPPL